MTPDELSHCIRLTFAPDAPPGNPVGLSKDATDKLANIPQLLRVLARRYGSKLEEPFLWGGDVCLPFRRDPELFHQSDTIASDLTLTVEELNDNAECQPPLPLAQAVTHPYCIDILRALSQANAKCNLKASICANDRLIELPHASLSVFTEPDASPDTTRLIRARVIGICVPTQDANVVLLADMSMLDLPFGAYPYTTDELYARVVKCNSAFLGQVETIRKDACRALPGGDLLTQPPL